MKVYQAINAIQFALSKIGITKEGRNTQGAGYNFRGIDQVYNTLSPLLAEHKLCILPRVVKSMQTERQSSSNKTLIYSYVTMEFDLVSSEDGSKHTICTVGEAFDSGDKSMNKAMSAAYKYAAFQAFAIPTEGDNDADAHTHEVAAKKVVITPSQGIADTIPPEEMQYLKELAVELIANVAEGNPKQALEMLDAENLESDQKVALWSLLDSKTRAAIKKAKET
jgi:hypothetical protein